MKQPTVSGADKPGQLVARHAPNCPNNATEQTGSEFPVLLFKSTALRAYGYLSLIFDRVVERFLNIGVPDFLRQNGQHLCFF